MVAGSDVRGIAGLASVTENLVIDGDSIMLDGISNGLKAVGETLKCGFKLTGLVQIEGANIRIRGVHFVTPAGPGAVAATSRMTSARASGSPVPRATSCSRTVSLRRQGTIASFGT